MIANEINSTFYALRMLSHGLDTSQIEVTDGDEYPASEFTREEQERALEIIHTIEESGSVSLNQLSLDKIHFHIAALADRIEESANNDLADAGYVMEMATQSPAQMFRQMGCYDWDRMKAEEITDLYLRKVAIGETMTMARLEIKEGAVTYSRSHKNEEMILVLRGCWRFHLPTGDVTLMPNQVLRIAPGIEHSSEALEDTVALDICAPAPAKGLKDADHPLHYDPVESLKDRA